MVRSVGRPRDELIDKNILKSTVDILTEKGYAGLKMDAVAARANISRRSLYLRYKTPAGLTVGLLKQLAVTTVHIPDNGNLKKDLKQMLGDIERLFRETPFGAVVPALVSASTDNPELVKQAREYLKTRRLLMEPVIRRAISRGELPESTNPGIFIELCVAPIYYRNLITGNESDDKYLNELIELVIK